METKIKKVIDGYLDRDRFRLGLDRQRKGSRLLDAQTGMAIDPVALLTVERIEMRDWERHDFAVQIVRGKLQK